ncbi:MAG: hypothetical protein WKF59_16280 [Chitinophagaceae bacterium]
MKGVIIVESQQDFDKWIAGEKPEYLKAMAPEEPAKTDSAAITKPVAP